MWRFLMSLYTTSIGMPRTVRWPLAVFMPCFDQVEQLVEPVVIVGQHAADRSLNPSFLHRIADPAVRLGVQDSRVDLHGDVIGGEAEVDERPPGSVVSPCWVDGVRLTIAELLGQGDQLLQVLPVLGRAL